MEHLSKHDLVKRFLKVLPAMIQKLTHSTSLDCFDSLVDIMCAMDSLKVIEDKALYAQMLTFRCRQATSTR